MKPILIVKKGSLSNSDKIRLRMNGLCVVEPDNLSDVQCLEPITASSSIIEATQKALAVRLLAGGFSSMNPDKRDYLFRGDVCRLFVDLLAEKEKAAQPATKP